jgi:chlorophyll/bacteriochlorophyll a synthase
LSQRLCEVRKDLGAAWLKAKQVSMLIDALMCQAQYTVMSGPASSVVEAAPRGLPGWRAVAELFKPITWFPPMWAFACGVVASGVPLRSVWPLLLVGVVLAGPMVCATSQAVNDWFDREVDAINEPQRPIPSGRIPGRWGLYIAVIWTAASLLVATALGRWGFAAAVAGLLLAWAYSAPPVRLKNNGWLGCAACGLSYEGLAWVTGAAVMAGGALPPLPSLWLAGLYNLGALGIMALNDFKAIVGDRQMGIRSLPVMLGAPRAAQAACVVMFLPQCVVMALLLHWGQPWHALAVAALLVGQAVLMVWFIKKPVQRALFYSGFGVPLFVAGMMVSAFALRAVAALN